MNASICLVTDNLWIRLSICTLAKCLLYKYHFEITICLIEHPILQATCGIYQLLYQKQWLLCELRKFFLTTNNSIAIAIIWILTKSHWFAIFNSTDLFHHSEVVSYIQTPQLYSVTVRWLGQDLSSCFAICRCLKKPFAHIPQCILIGANIQDLWLSCIVFLQLSWRS